MAFLPDSCLPSPAWGYRKELVLSKIRLRKDACNLLQAPDYKKKRKQNESSQIPSELNVCRSGIGFLAGFGEHDRTLF